MTGLVESSVAGDQSESGEVRDATEPIPGTVPVSHDGGWLAAIDGWRGVGWLSCGAVGGLAIAWFILEAPGEIGAKADWFFGAAVFCAVLVVVWQTVNVQRQANQRAALAEERLRTELAAAEQRSALERAAAEERSARELASTQKLHKAGYPVGLPMGQASDAVDWVGAFFKSQGVVFIDENDKIKINSDETRKALEFMKKLMAVNPPEVYAWDDAGNNRWLISGKGAGIMNPPSAWAVAKRDAPQVAEQCWTHGFPAGPKGRFAPYLPYFWSIWNFSKNKEAAKSLLVQLTKPAAIEKMVNASGGYDLPAYEKLTTLKIWQEEGPPKGTLYHYPNPYKHQTLSIAASPAPPKIAQQIYAQATLTKMCLRYHQGEAMEKTLAWAEGECEGFMRS